MPSPPPAPSSQSSQSSLPPPERFDIIPSLHTLLLRLLAHPLDPNNALPTLSLKDLATEAAAIKIKIRQARGAVEALPDVERTIGEQLEEIRELEEKIKRLNKVARDIAEAAKR